MVLTGRITFLLRSKPKPKATLFGLVIYNSGVADVAALTGDTAYLRANNSIWQNMVSKKIYVQGGLGALPGSEAFGANYELPNTTAYNETCAAIANAYWNYRMFLLHGNSKYFDVL